MSSFAPVLYVEDTEDDVFLMRRSFTRAKIPHPLVVKAHGREAIHYLEPLLGHAPMNPRTPCLMLLDVKMPFVNGLELLQWIRNHSDFRHVPVVMFSSSSQTRDIQCARRFGANSYVVKPSKLSELRILVEELGALCGKTVSEGTWISLSGSIDEINSDDLSA